MTFWELQRWLVKRLLPSGTRELIFDGGIWIATPGDHGKPVFSTLLQWDGDAITQLDLDAVDDAADLRPVAAKHMRAVELQLEALLRPLRRVEQAAVVGLILAWAGSIAAVQHGLKWSCIVVAAWAVVLPLVAQWLWPHLWRYGMRFLLRRLATLLGI